MSWQALAWAMKQKAGSPGCKLLLLALANHANQHGHCWPSQAALADCTELSMDSIQRHSRELHSAGLLTMSKQPRAKGQWPTLEYRLNIPTEPQPAVGSPTPTEPHPAAWSPSRTVPDGPSRKYPSDRAAPCGTNLKENHRKKDFEMNEDKEGQQPTGEPAVFSTYSKQWLAWLDYHEVTGNRSRADLMRHQAENGRWNTWAEPTPFPPPYAVNRKQADNR
jgi:Helix-turn-helix domain